MLFTCRDFSRDNINGARGYRNERLERQKIRAVAAASGDIYVVDVYSVARYFNVIPPHKSGGGGP